MRAAVCHAAPGRATAGRASARAGLLPVASATRLVDDRSGARCGRGFGRGGDEAGRRGGRVIRRRRRGARGEAGGRALIVATYNIHSCVGVDRRYAPDRVATVLRELGADIIGLQEIDARRRRSGELDQRGYLARSRPGSPSCPARTAATIAGGSATRC